MIEGVNTKNGLLTLGKNILVCYLCWKGYNFEDAIIINQRLIQKNIFTSTSTKKCKIFLLSNYIQEVKFISTNYYNSKKQKFKVLFYI